MGKIGLIIQREFLTRVKKRSFIIMTILGPILMGSIFIIPILLAGSQDKLVKIEVVDETGVYGKKFPNDSLLQFTVSNRTIEEAKNKFKDEDFTGILQIKQHATTNLPSLTLLHGQTQPSMKVMMTIQNTIANKLEELAGCDPKMLADIKGKLDVQTQKLGGEKTDSGMTSAVGYFAGILIYFFVFLYGSQVMNGVIEEKTNRIVEVLISSVKPFQLMMGKIIGISLVGLLQFLLWVVLTFGIYQVTTNISGKSKMEKYRSDKVMNQQVKGLDEDKGHLIDENGVSIEQEADSISATIESLPIKLIIFCFAFYFLGGYLLYAALFAAIGSAIDSDADKQQFMLPVTIPLILSMVVSSAIVVNPNGPVAVWFSMIPLTSPVTMMIRIPFGGVPAWQIALSMSLLIGGFLGATWLAAKIYRTGILMYGKKVNYKELAKWLRY